MADKTARIRRGETRGTPGRVRGSSTACRLPERGYGPATPRGRRAGAGTSKKLTEVHRLSRPVFIPVRPRNARRERKNPMTKSMNMNNRTDTATPSPELLRLLNAIRRVPERNLPDALTDLEAILDIHLRTRGPDALIEDDGMLPPKMLRSRRGKAFLTLWKTFYTATVREAVEVMQEFRVTQADRAEQMGAPSDLVYALRNGGPRLPGRAT